MEKCIIVICSLVWLISCAAYRKRNKTIKTFDNQTREAIAVDHLIKKYEKEHQKFYRAETENDTYFEWPALFKKNLSMYCSKYLQHSVPTKKNNYVLGIQISVSLSYGRENTGIISFIIVVKCRIKRKNRTFCYYITKAPEPNCVYSLKCTHSVRGSIFTIINKHCDFENRPLKQKRLEIISQINSRTGQPIAMDEYILQYELEHQVMFKEGKCIDWPHMAYSTLDYYCYQYIGECAPGRKREGVTGNLKIGKLHYQKLSNLLKFIDVTIITCASAKPTTVRYHMTKAPGLNCVFALLQRGYKKRTYESAHFVIIFKYCDFEYPRNQQVTSHNHYVPYIVPKTEVKEEPLDSLKPLPLFPQN